jgi:glycosyltransferase involved in cell wall biosynthesis
MKILIYQRVLPHYRIPFFDALYNKLQSVGIQLLVVAGNEKEGQVPKTVKVDRPWVEYRHNLYFCFLGKDLVVQKIKLSDLKSQAVIVEQSNRLFINYFLLLLGKLGFFKIGLWGHGRNFQSSSPSGTRELFKRKFSRLYDWWFCYTPKGKDILSADSGCPRDKITVVRNSIEHKDFEKLKTNSDYKALDLGGLLINHDSKLGIYCGGVYHEKRIDFLLESLSLIKRNVAGFVFVFIGDGPEIYKVIEFEKNNEAWFKYVGAKSGAERAEFFRYAKVFLMPGLVGLAVLDSFASSVPMVTTDIDYHSPEIDYLVDGFNGVIVKDNLETYVQKVTDLLVDNEAVNTLKHGCRESADLYSIENMSSNYAEGVMGLLGVDNV